MQLSIRDAAALLNVSETAVYRYLDDGDIPACRVGEDVRFNRAELVEWATLKKLPLSPAILKEPAGGVSLADAIAAGGVRRDLCAGGPEQVLRAMVSSLPLPQAADSDVILEMLLARGEQAMTPVGEGIAIPHVRHPAIAAACRPLATLFFLKEPIDLKAPDARPVGALFFLLSPTVRVHLLLLSRLAVALRDEGFKAVLERRAGAEDIVREARRVEAML
ncbi:MAG: PTS sugar transporter subunit IIA [Elusimicrobia bacterium]|nr:PTS sugar transporter subunit IIA [Elusimicrobiota bacterium]